MRRYTRALKDAWSWALEPPWKHSGTDEESKWPGTAEATKWHLVVWILSWVWALAGLVLGAIVAPMLLQLVGRADSPYQDWFVIAFAVLAGFLAQFLGWTLVFSVVLIEKWMDNPIILGLSFVWIVAGICAPLAGVGYGFYLYFTLVASDQRSVTIAFVGGLLVKTLLIPLIKGIVTGAAFKALMRWLRGGKNTKSA